MGLETSRYRAARRPSYKTKERFLTEGAAPAPLTLGGRLTHRNPGRAPRTALGPQGPALPVAGTSWGSAPGGPSLGPAATAPSTRPRGQPLGSQEPQNEIQSCSRIGTAEFGFFFFFSDSSEQLYRIEKARGVGRCLKGRCEEDGCWLNKTRQELSWLQNHGPAPDALPPQAVTVRQSPPLQGPVGRKAPSSPLGAVRAVAARPSMPSQPSRPGRVPAASLVRLSGGRGARPGRSSSYPQGCHRPASRFNAKRRLLKFLSSLSATAYCYQV